MDKAGIVISIVMVIIGVGFATFSSNSISDVSESKTTSIKDRGQEMMAEMLIVKKPCKT